MTHDPLDVDLNDIRVFVEVVKAQSFTGAGRALGMPRSTVSRRIAKLEKRLGARLLHRTTRRLQLTDIGSSYFERCAQSLSAIDDAEVEVRASQDTPRGRIRVTAPHDLGRHLAPVVRRVIGTYPDVTIDVELTQRMVDLVGEGFDLALRAASQMPDSSLIARRIGGGDALLYASPAYLAARGTPHDIGDLAAHDCLVLGGGRNHTWRLIKNGEEITVPVSGRVYVNDPAFTRTLALGDAGIGLIPEFLACELVASGQLVRVLPDYHAHSSGLYVVYPSAKHLSATVRAFRDALIEELSELPLGQREQRRKTRVKAAKRARASEKVSRAASSSG
ncbi:MAG: LysR family transcriptional regulator [Polyangiaceae bacterium]